jgi:CBS domain-containing protein
VWCRYRPDTITCVERSTPIRDALRLMLGNGLLYVPVIENDLPTDIISMRDINLFLARNDACEEQ